MLHVKPLAQGIAVALLAFGGMVQAAEEPERGSPIGDQEQTAKKQVSQDDPHLVNALAQWLSGGNKAEVEFGRLASERASNPKVKEFAQQMVEDHGQYLKKLEKFTTTKGSLQTKLGEGQPSQQNRKTFEDPKPDQRVTDKKPAEKIGQDSAIEQRVGYRGDVHATMQQIGKDACDLRIKMTKDLLNQYQGNAFDMAYVGHQIASHTNMLAELKAIEKHTSGEFSKVVQEGVATTEAHLEHAKQLSKALEGEAGSRTN